MPGATARLVVAATSGANGQGGGLYDYVQARRAQRAAVGRVGSWSSGCVGGAVARVRRFARISLYRISLGD